MISQYKGLNCRKNTVHILLISWVETILNQTKENNWEQHRQRTRGGTNKQWVRETNKQHFPGGGIHTVQGGAIHAVTQQMQNSWLA